MCDFVYYIYHVSKYVHTFDLRFYRSNLGHKFYRKKGNEKKNEFDDEVIYWGEKNKVNQFLLEFTSRLNKMWC